MKVHTRKCQKESHPSYQDYPGQMPKTSITSAFDGKECRQERNPRSPIGGALWIRWQSRSVTGGHRDDYSACHLIIFASIYRSNTTKPSFPEVLKIMGNGSIRLHPHSSSCFLSKSSRTVPNSKSEKTDLFLPPRFVHALSQHNGVWKSRRLLYFRFEQRFPKNSSRRIHWKDCYMSLETLSALSQSISSAGWLIQ